MDPIAAFTVPAIAGITRSGLALLLELAFHLRVVVFDGKKGILPTTKTSVLLFRTMKDYGCGGYGEEGSEDGI